MSNETVSVLRMPGGDGVQIEPEHFDPKIHQFANPADAVRVALAKANRAANDWRPASDPQSATECSAADAEREAFRKSVRAEWLERLDAA